MNTQRFWQGDSGQESLPPSFEISDTTAMGLAKPHFGLCRISVSAISWQLTTKKEGSYPDPGKHTDVVLKELVTMTGEEIDRLRQLGIV